MVTNHQPSRQRVKFAWVVASFGFDALVYLSKQEDLNPQSFSRALDCLDSQQRIAAKVVQSIGRLVVGDWVKVQQQKTGWVVIEILARQNFIERIGSYNKCKLHCANIDQLVAVLCPLPTVGFYVVDCLLMTCLWQRISPVFVANKCDLEGFNEWFEDWQSYYQWLAPKWLVCSAETGQGIEELKQVLQAKVSFLIGSSGVGKSSIVNALMSKEVAATQSVSLANFQGQHTTTNSQAYEIGEGLLDGGLLVDSPGIKEFMLGDYDGFEVAFRDVVELAEYCQFRNCAHQAEVGCAVKQAIQNNRLSEARLLGYQFFVERYQKQQQKNGR